jgi:Zn-dependent protease
VFAARLKALGEEAQAREAAGDGAGALAAWRAALELLPSDSRQAVAVASAIERLAAIAPAPAAAEAPAPHPDHPWLRRGGVVAALLLAVWKLKWVAVLVLGKGKLLLAGLTQAQTLLTLVLSLGAYWAAWGWRFAAGLVASMYVHEMGHVAALRARGIAASAPVFVPGLGAFVRLRQAMPSAAADARVGLAGPVWGAGAAVACLVASVVSGWPALAAIARVGAVLNLFNLLPVWQLDGGRAFRALSRPQRLAAAAAAGVAWALTHEGMLVLVALAAVFRALLPGAPERGDRGALAIFVAVLATLAALSVVPVALPA